jgi:hypothetical protein
MRVILMILLLAIPACTLPPAREPKIMPIVVPVQDSVPFNLEGYTLEGEFEDDTIGQPRS